MFNPNDPNAGRSLFLRILRAHVEGLTAEEFAEREINRMYVCDVCQGTRTLALLDIVCPACGGTGVSVE